MYHLTLLGGGNSGISDIRAADLTSDFPNPKFRVISSTKPPYHNLNIYSIWITIDVRWSLWTSDDPCHHEDDLCGNTQTSSILIHDSCIIPLLLTWQLATASKSAFNTIAYRLIHTAVPKGIRTWKLTRAYTHIQSFQFDYQQCEDPNQFYQF